MSFGVRLLTKWPRRSVTVITRFTSRTSFRTVNLEASIGEKPWLVNASDWAWQHFTDRHSRPNRTVNVIPKCTDRTIDKFPGVIVRVRTCGCGNMLKN